MVASGPFALGPAMAGTSSSRRFAQAATPIPAPSNTKASPLGAGLSQTAAPKIKREEQKLEKDEDEEIYSDADEGVEIIDMENVGQMDWMAPDSIIKEKTKRPKKEDPDATGASCSVSLSRVLTYAVQEVNIANALDGDEDEADEQDLETMFDDLNKMNYVRLGKRFSLENTLTNSGSRLRTTIHNIYVSFNFQAHSRRSAHSRAIPCKQTRQ